MKFAKLVNRKVFDQRRDRSVVKEIAVERGAVARRCDDMPARENEAIRIDDEAAAAAASSRWHIHFVLTEVLRSDAEAVLLQGRFNGLDRRRRIVELRGRKRADANDRWLHLVDHLPDIIEVRHIAAATERCEKQEDEEDAGQGCHG